MRFCYLLIALAPVALVGCAAKPSMHPTAAALPAAGPTSRPIASLTLSEIKPIPHLPEGHPLTTQPATEPSDSPPVDALVLYAHARDALLQNERYTSITLLEKAITLDPNSYELRYSLGQAYGSVGSSNDQAIDAYNAAATLEPDHLDLQTELGREYLGKGNLDEAIEHLRLALETDGYRHDEPLAAVTEFYLGRALEAGGYHQAAVEVYQRLFDRLKRGGVPARVSPELNYLVNRPAVIAARLGELHEKLGQYDQAIEDFQFIADQRPEMLDAQRRVITAMVKAGRQTDAEQRAAECVRRFRASNDAIDLLKQAYSNDGGDAAVARELLRLHEENLDDHAILYALVDVLGRSNRSDEAIAILEKAAERSHDDPRIVQQLFKLYDQKHDTRASARLLILALANHPDAIRDLANEWSDLLRYSRRNRLTIPMLQAIQVPPEAQASKLLWISRLAEIWNRDILARTSLERSVKLTPAFAPSYRVLVVEYATRAQWDPARRQRETKALIDTVRVQGDQILAIELEGLASLATGHAAVAAQQFGQAIKLGGDSVDLHLSYAAALSAANDQPRAERALWDLVKDHPTCEDAYAALFRGFLEAHQPKQAVKVLGNWLRSTPNSIDAHIVQASVLLQAGRTDAAKKILLDLFDRHPDNSEVLQVLSAFYQRIGHLDEFIAMLESERASHPENRVAIEQLVTLYASEKRAADAIRVLDATRAAVAGDPDLLYYVGSLYARVDQKRTQEQILEEIVKQSPDYAPASNDLGYSWADRGENLNRAEELIRTAVKQEPDNESFLDSLGWVLYKRGKFAEARKYLDQAIAPASYPDPVVLDHLGDVLYRLGRKDDALRQWKRSQERLNETANPQRDDLAQLRLQLQQKIRQADANQAVTVAPTATNTK